jgi:kynurenine 3-monooxygenase
MTSTEKPITLIGAGLTGPLLAILLRQRGYAVEIYERRADMRRVGAEGGRSINLALSARGIHALQQAGLWDRMRQIALPMKGRMMHAVPGDLTFQPYGKNPADVIYSISRADLNIALMNAAEENGVEIRFQHRCVEYDLKAYEVTLLDEEKNEQRKFRTEHVIACDGSASALRSAMLKLPRFDFSQQHLDYGYKELTLPASAGGGHLLEVNALHIWPRGNHMLIALPNVDGTFACILFLPFDGPVSFARIGTRSDVEDFFRQYFPDALAMMPKLAENYFSNPTGSMVTVRCSPWHVAGNALLLGDAAHAIVPFFGQGINCGFEDCTSLISSLETHGPDWQLVFSEFQQDRKVNTDAIADMAIENFTEMRDRVADPRFLLRKKVELAIEARYPDLFAPKYSMVTFLRHVPYSVAMARGASQDLLLTELCQSIHAVEDLDWEKAELLVHRDLKPLERTH